MKSFQYYFFIFLSLGTLLIQASHATFKSNIFEFDDPLRAKNLHVCLEGDYWKAKEVSEQDLPFYVQLFGNPNVMKSFADGKPFTPETTEKILRNFWIPRFQNGQPYGALKIYDIKTQEEWGHFIVVPQKGKEGVAEIGYVYAEKCWGRGLASSIVNKIVHEWAPEVRRIGQGLGLDTSKYANIVSSFQCEGKPLNWLYATADPSNLGSCKVLEKLGFRAAVSELLDIENVINFNHKEIHSYAMLETDLMELFNDPNTDYKVDKWYSLIDHEGKRRTFSKKSNYKKIRFHFEYQVQSLSEHLAKL